jgi:hypothetical protein
METRTKVLDLKNAASHLCALGFSGATIWTVRGLIHSGDVKAMRLARKDFVSVEDLDSYVERALSRPKSGAFAGHGEKRARKAR